MSMLKFLYKFQPYFESGMVNLENNDINKIIKKLCKEILPQDVFQKSDTRVYYDDNGYYLTVVEFQPYSLEKGTFLNAGVSFLFDKSDYISYSYSYDDNIRIGRKFIKYINDSQFESEVRTYVELAGRYVLRYREFRDINHAKDYIVKTLNDYNWNKYIKAMFYFLTDDRENGAKYYNKFLNSHYFKRIIEQYDYPRDPHMIDRDYVLEMIKNKRRWLHGRKFMKKMKTFQEYE